MLNLQNPKWQLAAIPIFFCNIFSLDRWKANAEKENKSRNSSCRMEVIGDLKIQMVAGCHVASLYLQYIK